MSNSSFSIVDDDDISIIRLFYISISMRNRRIVMSDQDNTIRTLSRILGRDHNDQHLHDMHNTIFGGLMEQSGRGKEGMDLTLFQVH